MDWKSQLEGLRGSLPQGDEAADAGNIGAAASAGIGGTYTAGAGTAANDAGSEAAAEAAHTQGRLDIILDKKGRKGKAATIIAGFTLSDDEVDAIAAKLKSRLGCGGSARGGEILIQGDKRTQVSQALATMGFKSRII